jgi:FkbM family methyltransferase
MDNAEHILVKLINQLDVPVDIVKMFASLRDHPNFPSMLAISDTLNEWGISNWGCSVEFEQLSEVPTPFIAFLKSRNFESVLINDVNDNYAELSNEVYKNEQMPINTFKDVYNGTVLIIDQASVTKLKRLNKSKAWKKRATGSEAAFFNKEPLPHKITYLDIGASYGLPIKWEQYIADELFELMMVEPDEIQASELRKQYPRARIIQYALGNKREKANLNVTFSQSCSSVLEPDMDVLDRFEIKEWFRVTHKVEVDVYRFKDLADAKGLNIPHFVKIDVQGFEYEVLKGFGKLLDKVLCIELETHLTPLYKNEKSLLKINAFLKSKGFYMRHLENVGQFEGEVLEFNVYFIKRDKNLKTEKDKELIQFWERVNQIPEGKKCL